MKAIRVLVIDDEIAVSKMLDIALSRKGYQVDTADSGENGLEKLQSNVYNLVLTDMKMGKMSGEEVLENVRKLKGDGIPVIAMSGNPLQINGHQFDAVLPKPFSFKLLYEMVLNCLSPTDDFEPTP